MLCLAGISDVSKEKNTLVLLIIQLPDNYLCSPVDEKKNPVYANTSDIAMQQHQQSLVASTLLNNVNVNNANVNNAEIPQQNNMSATDLHHMESLKAENDRLRGQLGEYAKKIGRVASLEQEMAKIHQAYQALLKHSEKK